MAHTNRDVQYRVDITGPEMKLIGLALAGKIKPGSREAREAAELNVALLRQIKALTDTEAEVAAGALKRAEEALASIAGPEGSKGGA